MPEMRESTVSCVSTRKTGICVISNDDEILIEIETPTEPDRMFNV